MTKCQVLITIRNYSQSGTMKIHIHHIVEKKKKKNQEFPSAQVAARAIRQNKEIKGIQI